MKREETQLDSTQSDHRLEQALDRLGALLASQSATDSDFVSHVMCRIRGAEVEVWQPRLAGRWLTRLAIASAACLFVALALWRTMSDLRSSAVTVATDEQPERVAATKPAVDAAPIVRTSTWSTVSESVVLERDMPVRKLFYREFERVELLDAQGNTESRLIVPTKAMLVATKEWY